MPRQISARYGLMTADQVEHDTAVDIARRFAGRYLEIGQINLSHYDFGRLRSSDLLLCNLGAVSAKNLLVRGPNHIIELNYCQVLFGV